MTDHDVVQAQAAALDFWEPWKPRIGQRVMVRLSAECQQDFEAFGERTGSVEPLPGHPAVMDGHVGTIEVQESWENAHRYCVRFDQPIRRTGGRLIGRAIFAAIELMPEPAGGEP